MNNNEHAPAENAGQTDFSDLETSNQQSETTSKAAKGQARSAKPQSALRSRSAKSDVKPASKSSSKASQDDSKTDSKAAPKDPVKKPAGAAAKRASGARTSSSARSGARSGSSRAGGKNVKPEADLVSNEFPGAELSESNQADAEKAYNLHQDTELWPEAWPDAENATEQMSSGRGANSQSDFSQDIPADIDDEISSFAAPVAEEQKRGSAVAYGENMTDAPLLKERPRTGRSGASGGDVMATLHLPMAPDLHDEESDLIRTFDEVTTPEYTGDCDLPEEMHTPSSKSPKADKKKAAAPQKSPVTSAKGKKRKMFISVLPGEQIEVAITGENQVQEYYVQMLHQVKTKGNIYKGVIHNVDANLQAAFVSYGAHKNGFLQIDEVHPDYYLSPHDPSKGKKYPLIQKMLKAGQEVLVQVVKEPTGGKGAFLSTYLSIPGRFLVLTPGRTQFGVSRKVDDEDDRERLRALLDTLPTQEGLGVIVRTASLSASKTSMLKDLQVLKRQWKEVRTRGTTEPAPCLVYEEPSLAGRAVRDYLSDDITEIWVDDAETAEEIKDTVSLIFPRRASSNLIRLHSQANKSMWEAFDLQRQIDQIYSREVVLPSGGRLVFDQTEALMAVDINSGKIAGRSNFESMALRTNIEAAQVIAQQLRLRDIGGQIVIDFIEMRERNHWRELEKVMRNAMKIDRARYDVAKVSSFGLMEVVRQRLGSSSISVTMEACPCCGGTGLRRNMEWQALHALREMQHLAQHKNGNEIRSLIYETDSEVALYLLNNKRSALAALEERYDVNVEIRTK